MEKLYVIKVGGNILDDPEQLEGFLAAFASISGAKILVHGGGKIASAIGRKLGIEPVLVDGRRITDAETLELVTMVYGGLINKNLVATLQKNGCNAIGLTGPDANIIPAVKRPVQSIDYGFAGDITNPESINSDVLEVLLDAGLTPVFAPLTHDGNGTMLNTNADTIAAALATALAQKYDVELLYLFEKKGVLRDVINEDSVIPNITETKYEQLKNEGIIAAGMLPKLDNAMLALRQGVKQVHICHASAVKALAQGHSFTGTTLSL